MTMERLQGLFADDTLRAIRIDALYGLYIDEVRDLTGRVMTPWE